MSFDIKGPEPTPQQITENNRATSGFHDVKPAYGSGDAFKLDPNYHKIADFLGLKDTDKLDFEVANKVSFIRDFTKQKNESDALVSIKNMIRKLGISSQGKDLVTNLYRFARLSQDRENLDKEISVYSNEKPKKNGDASKFKVQVKQLKGALEQALTEKRRLSRKVNEVLKVLTK